MLGGLSAADCGTYKIYEAETILQDVINGGFCIGCGACAAVSKSPIEIRLDRYQRYQAVLPRNFEHTGALDVVCPFADNGVDEDVISDSLFSGPGFRKDARIGHFINLYAGNVVEGSYRENGSSGGFVTWILGELLRLGHIDFVVHVKPCSRHPEHPVIFEYAISESIQSLAAGAKSHYYPVEMSGVLKQIREKKGRYAVVGVPCFIKALRLLARNDEIFRDRLVFTVGLFCGHLKSAAWADLLAHQLGIKVGELQAINFRKKIAGRPATAYGVEVESMGKQARERVLKSSPMGHLLGNDWGMGLFKYPACDFCDDITAETADVSVGDAWLPAYTQDHRGTNVLVVRNNIVQDIIDTAVADKRVNLTPLAADEIVESQSANYRHRREDLAYRLYLKDVAGLWRPRKRVSATNSIDKHRKSVQEIRIRFRDLVPDMWIDSLRTSNMSLFYSSLLTLVADYQNLYVVPRLRPRFPRLWNIAKKLYRIVITGKNRHD